MNELLQLKTELAEVATSHSQLTARMVALSMRLHTLMATPVVDVGVIVGVAAGVWGVSPEGIYGEDRHMPLPMARDAVWTCLLNRGWTQGRIGEAFGRSASAVHYGRDAFLDALATDKETSRKYARFNAILGQYLDKQTC